MKEGWTYKKLGEVAAFMSGYTPAKGEIFQEGSFPYFKVAEMNIPGNEFYLKKTSLFVNAPKRIFPKGSIVFPKNGGAIYTEKKRILFFDSVIDLNSEAIIPNQFVELKYLFYFLTFIRISKFDKGGGLPSLDLNKMSDSLIPVPPLSEQRAIVARLDSAFSQIDALKANAEKQLSEARQLFQKALEEAMTPKEGWEEKKLGEVGSFSRGINFLKSDFVKDGFPCIHYGQIHTKLGTATYKHLTCIPESLVRVDKLASKGDIIFAITSEDVEASCKSTAWLGDYPIAIGAHAAIFKHTLNPIFVSYFIQSESFQNQKKQYVHGFKVMEIKPSDIAKIEICYPSESEQQSIVSRLDALSAKVKRLEANCEQTIRECDALKQAMLREIFE
ncbi:MAG: restriction endonuclease subunit S [Bacteroidaceae bacterium]|nr:restriction endonuclease subunit S [Bacteroidaceae bacterium]